jgi:hypothetical protein
MKAERIALHATVAIMTSLVLAEALPASSGDDPLAGPYFTNVTADVGLTSKPGFRLSVADVNGDGYPDIYLIRQQDDMTGDVLNKQYLFLNLQCEGSSDPRCRNFVDATAGSGIRANRQGTADGRHQDGAIFADVDNDGDLDMFSMVYVHRNYTLDVGRNDLLLNDGAGHFTLAPNSAFHTEPVWNTAGAVFTDYDNDGKVDLYIGNWYNPDNTLTVDELYRGNGDGSFVNVTTPSGLGSKTACIYGLATFDWNSDGFADLFAPPYAWTVSNSIPLHWRNNQNGTFTRVEAATNYDDYRGTASTVASFGSMPADYNNDGYIDFLEILTHGKGDAGTCALGSIHTTVVTNLGPPSYTFSWDCSRVKNRGTEDTDLTHHGDHYATWFDFDGDGLLDFALTEGGYTQPSGGYNNRVYLFKQASDHTFSPVTVESGLNAINTLPGNPNPHNVLALDYDLDGDDDFLVGFADDVTGIELWRNDVGTNNRWITVTLVGAGKPNHANRASIGARVQVTAGGITHTREVYAGNGHMGPQVTLSLTFGLGSAPIVDSIRVRWPNHGLTTTELTNVAVNQFVRIAEPCPLGAEPANLLADKSGSDVLLTWDDPATPGLTWNVHRGSGADHSGWGPPLAAGVTDADPTQPGIQYRDTGALGSATSYYYLVSSVNECGETPIP